MSVDGYSLSLELSAFSYHELGYFEMKIIKNKRLFSQFKQEIYHSNPLFITSDQFWDGGIKSGSPLSEKAAFYSIAEMMSRMIKEFIQALGENPLAGQAFCEYERMFADWSDSENFEIYRQVSQTFKDNRCYQLTLPGDNDIIDLIIESNFRYFSYVSLYLPKSGIILQPSCHTEILVYADSDAHFRSTLEDIISKYNGTIKVKT